ncbi:S8 family serine peptidase [Alphaproteobacteria bacterium LSUCC0719]
MKTRLALALLFFLTNTGAAFATPTSEMVCDWVAAAVAAPDGSYRVDDAAGKVTVNLRPPGPAWRLATIDIRDMSERPLMQIRVLPSCQPLEARRLVRAPDGSVDRIEVLAPDFKRPVAIEPQNPPLPRLSAGTGSAVLALVDTGVNYLLPALHPHLATGADGRPLGHDFWDDDDRPYDSDPRANPYFPRHHGTTVFSVLAREAPDTDIAIYRFPAPDMCRFEELINHMASLSVRIVSLSMGSDDRSDWHCFERAAQLHPQMLFVVSAGNDGRDLDQMPVYPAALALTNMVVVTSSDNFGRLGRGSNSAAVSVDVMVPAEQIEVIDHRGAFAETGGTSYAVPRVAALAARFLAANPDAVTADIIGFLASRAIPAPGVRLGFGWIPDPTDDFGF